MKTVLHKAADRGHADHGWLNAYHSFSFAGYYDPEKTHFGVLRVLNDDTVAPGKGFGQHPHDNMEIITIPLAGTLEHKDSMGNTGTISFGEVQVMSAGSGITHSEYNHSKSEPVSLLQIWIFPNIKNVKPRYDQIRYNLDKINNNWLQIVSPQADDEGTWVYQEAWFHIGRFSKESYSSYEIKKEGNGIYIFVISGSVEILDYTLSKRDALGLRDAKKVSFNFLADSLLLLMEVPMQIGAM
ncbi:MAG: pirin family protein [Chitinophagaceae bacterium]|nr:pirin family protein [Chitinophagaceae bacterium]